MERAGRRSFFRSNILLPSVKSYKPKNDEFPKSGNLLRIYRAALQRPFRRRSAPDTPHAPRPARRPPRPEPAPFRPGARTDGPLARVLRPSLRRDRRGARPRRLLPFARSEDCASCVYRFTEYLFDGRRRIVYLQECDYLGMIVTFLDYVDAVLRSRRPFRQPVRNIRLFAFHTYPPRFTVLENRYRDGQSVCPDRRQLRDALSRRTGAVPHDPRQSSPRPAVPKRPESGPAPCVAGRRPSGLRSGSSSGTPGSTGPVRPIDQAGRACRTAGWGSCGRGSRPPARGVDRG